MANVTIPKTYKAASCPAPGKDWELITVESREPSTHEVVLRVHASGVCNSDHFVKNGFWPGLTYPRITGHEVVGRIVAIGSALQASDVLNKKFPIGALVGVGWNGGYCQDCDMCRKGENWACDSVKYTGFSYDGGHAEYVYAPHTAIVHFSEEDEKMNTYSELAPLLCAGTTVFGAIKSTKWSPGDLCVVQGIGGLGHLSVQYASKMGLKVLAVSSGPEKRDLALSLGAHDYLDSSATDVTKHIQSLGGAKVIISTAPFAKLISAIIPAVARNGTVVLVSGAIDGPVEFQNLPLALGRATIRGWACGHSADSEECVKFSTLTGVKTMVNEFSLEDYPKAYEATQNNTARFRNVVVFP